VVGAARRDDMLSVSPAVDETQAAGLMPGCGSVVLFERTADRRLECVSMVSLRRPR
jgi:hypothetical protein